MVHAHLDVPLSNSVFVQWSEPAESCQVYVVRRFEMHAEAVRADGAAGGMPVRVSSDPQNTIHAEASVANY